MLGHPIEDKIAYLREFITGKRKIKDLTEEERREFREVQKSLPPEVWDKLKEEAKEVAEARDRELEARDRELEARDRELEAEQLQLEARDRELWEGICKDADEALQKVKGFFNDDNFGSHLALDIEALNGLYKLFIWILREDDDIPERFVTAVERINAAFQEFNTENQEALEEVGSPGLLILNFGDVTDFSMSEARRLERLYDDVPGRGGGGGSSDDMVASEAPGYESHAAAAEELESHAHGGLMGKFASFFGSH